MQVGRMPRTHTRLRGVKVAYWHHTCFPTVSDRRYSSGCRGCRAWTANCVQPANGGADIHVCRRYGWCLCNIGCASRVSCCRCRRPTVPLLLLRQDTCQLGFTLAPLHIASRHLGVLCPKNTLNALIDTKYADKRAIFLQVCCHGAQAVPSAAGCAGYGC